MVELFLQVCGIYRSKIHFLCATQRRYDLKHEHVSCSILITDCAQYGGAVSLNGKQSTMMIKGSTFAMNTAEDTVRTCLGPTVWGRHSDPKGLPGFMKHHGRHFASMPICSAFVCSMVERCIQTTPFN